MDNKMRCPLCGEGVLTLKEDGFTSCGNDRLAKPCAGENADFPAYRLRWCKQERIDRERRLIERCTPAAHCPSVNSLGSFDFTAMLSLNKVVVLELARCGYIAQRENLIALGHSGTGKTPVALD